MVFFGVGAYVAKTGTVERPLRGNVVQGRIGDHSDEGVICRQGQERHHRLSGVALTASRRGQAVADFDATVFGLTLEADPPYRPTVGQARDPVVAERPLLAMCR